MKYPIWKERLHLMSPAVAVCAMASFDQPPDPGLLREAAALAVRRHAVLSCRAVIDPDGTAYLTECDKAWEVSLSPFTGDVGRLILAQEAVPFAIDEGETVRFFYGGDASRPTLVVMAHHLVCDGGSIVILMRDILRAVNGQALADQPVRLLTRGDLPAHPGLSPFLRVMMKRANAKWARSGRTFSFDEYKTMAAAYAASRPAEIRLRVFDAPRTQRLVRLARENDITVNSLLIAALAACLPRGESVGIAVDVNPQDRASMGNYAIGVGVCPPRDAKRSLPENAVSAHRAVVKCLNNPGKRFFLHEFMGALAPALLDSIYFSAFGGYRNPVSESLRGMCGYVDQRKGATLTNLKTLDMPSDASLTYRFDTLAFVPPYIPNVRAVIGVSTYADRMTLALRAPAGDPWKEEEARFDRFCQTLEAL